MLKLRWLTAKRKSAKLVVVKSTKKKNEKKEFQGMVQGLTLAEIHPSPRSLLLQVSEAIFFNMIVHQEKNTHLHLITSVNGVVIAIDNSLLSSVFFNPQQWPLFVCDSLLDSASRT